MDKVLIARKTTVCFIEKVFNFCDLFINHDDIKEILYEERNCKNPLEYKIKQYYDAYMYLLHNAKNPLSSEVFNRFYYIMKESVPDLAFVQDIVSTFFYLHEFGTIEKAIKFHLFVNQKMNGFEKIDRLLIPLMFLNYCLVAGNIPTIKMPISILTEYVNKLKEYEAGNVEIIIVYLTSYILSSKTYSINYMEKLKELSSMDVVKRLKEDEIVLKGKYYVESLILCGSFGKGKERIDSDIDLILSLNKNLLIEDRRRIIKELEEKYSAIFGRYVDIQEMNYLLTDEFIKEAVNVKIIFMEEVR